MTGSGGGPEDTERRALIGDQEAKITLIHERLDRLEEAVLTMASWLVQAQTGFGAKDAEGIAKIVKGTE